MDLTEELCQEIKRNEEALDLFKSYGSAASFAVSGLEKTLENGKAALVSTDKAAKEQAIEELKTTDTSKW